MENYKLIESICKKLNLIFEVDDFRCYDDGIADISVLVFTSDKLAPEGALFYRCITDNNWYLDKHFTRKPYNSDYLNELQGELMKDVIMNA